MPLRPANTNDGSATRSAIRHTRRLAGVILALVLLATACSDDDRREIRLTPTSTVETGVRILADNCPGPSSVALSVREDVLWQIEAPAAPADVIEPIETDDAAVAAEPEPGLVEFLVGQAPETWTTTTELEVALQPGIRYTIRTLPDGQTIDFATPDLSPGLLWNGRGNAQFNPDLINVECSEAADVGAFARSIVVLLALGATTAAIVLVVLILVLFVVTRRFSRVRSLQKRAANEAQRPRARSSS